MKIKTILEITNGKLIIGNKEEEITKISKDTRTIKPGETYLGIKGENFDGNQLWEEAIKKGAKTVIIQDININNKEILKKYNQKNIILVPNTLKAIADIATYTRKLYDKNFILIGITGSVGKTSTKDIIANVVAQKYNTLKTEGNNNNNIGLPLTITKLKNHEAAVIEMGMNHLGEIRNLSQIAKPTIAVITNIGTAHIGILGSRENILKAKLEILESMETKELIINNDNDMLNKYAQNIKNQDIKIYTYGIKNKSDVMAENITLNENNSQFTCNIKGEKIEITVPVGGIHFIYNALCAVTVGKKIGLTNDQIKRGIETFELTKKRMDIEELKNKVTIINDTYNASYESMQATIKYLKQLNKKRKIAVLGDMYEQGNYTEELHRKIGKEVAKANIDILITIGENSKYIIKEAQKNGMKKENTHHFQTQEEAQNYIKKIWEEGDVILFKAANGMKFFNIVENLKKYI